MNVNELCATPPNVSHPMETDDSTLENRNVVKEETANAALTNTTNTTPSSYYNNTLSTSSQQQFPKQHLPNLIELPPTYGSSTEDTTSEPTDTGDTVDMKKLIDKCSYLCHNLARYKTLQKDYSEKDQEATFDYITHTTHEILDSLVTMQQQREAVVLNEAEYTMIRQARNWKENRKPKYRRRSKRSIIGQRCHSCHTSETPEWRRGPDGARTLCNACGLHYSKLLRKESVTVLPCKLLTNGSSKSDTKLLERQPHDLRQRYPRIIGPHHPAYESQQLRQQSFHLQSPIPLSSSADASTSSPPSSASTSGSTNTTSSSSSFSSSQLSTTTTSDHSSLYHITH